MPRGPIPRGPLSFRLSAPIPKDRTNPTVIRDWSRKRGKMQDRRTREGGFSLVETIVALGIMGVVMAAVTPFLIQSVILVHLQRTTQAATRIAGDAIEQARALQGASLLKGRGVSRATAQWQAAPVAIQPYLAGMALAWDPTLSSPASDSGVQAALPTQAVVVTMGGVTYTKNFYVGRCREQAGVANGSCRPTDQADADPAVADVPFFRVVVAVTWNHRGCKAGLCSYVTSTLISSALDSRFNLKRPAPTVTDPGMMVSYRAKPESRQMDARGGLLPLTWSLHSGRLPTGLSMSSTGLVTGTPSVSESVSFRVRVTDRSGAASNPSPAITWKIVEPLTMTNPNNQTSHVGTADSLSLTATGGVPPVVWSVDLLPAGLSINATTGVVSGTPSTEQTTTVTFSGTDTNGGTVSKTVTWQVFKPVQPQGPGDQTVAMNSAVTYTFGATGGLAPYTWRAVNLPVGLTINTGTGVVSGAVTHGTRYVSTVYVKDAAGSEVPLRVVFTVSTTVPTDLRVTSPAPTAPDRVSTARVFVSLTAVAAGSAGAYTWTAIGLPTGLSLSGATISGTPTAKGTYPVTLTVRDASSRYASLDLIWTVN